MNNKTVLLLILLLEIVACSQIGKKVETIVLASDTTFTELSDSTFVPTRIACMNMIEDDLYFSDYSGGIIVLNKDMKLKRKIGINGEGPGEFLGAACFCVNSNDSIFIVNEGKHAFELFVNNEHTKHIPYPEEFSFTSGTRFFSKEQCVYHSVISDSFPSVAFDYNIYCCKPIFNCTSLDNPNLKLHSGRHLIKGEGFYYVIGCTLPVFQIYAMDGKQIAEYDLEKIPEVREEMVHYKKTQQVPNTCFIMVQDVYYDNKKIYLLLSGSKPEFFCNTICVLDVARETKHIQTFKLPGDVYGSFCVGRNNKLVAFNVMSASIDVFTMTISN